MVPADSVLPPATLVGGADKTAPGGSLSGGDADAPAEPDRATSASADLHSREEPSLDDGSTAGGVGVAARELAGGVGVAARELAGGGGVAARELAGGVGVAALELAWRDADGERGRLPVRSPDALLATARGEWAA